MDLIEELQAEHREALRRLDGLEATLAAFSDGPAEVAAETVQAFAVGWEWFAVDLNLHFRKEEEALFPAAAGTMPLEAGPIAQMKAEHREFEELREQVVGALETVRHGCCGKHEATGRLRRSAEQLCALLREHIWKEDNILFPMMRNMMGEAALGRAAKAASRISLQPAAVRS